MLKERGTIVDIQDDGVWVETLQQSACAQCSARSGCGQRVLANSVVKNMSRIKAHYLPGGDHSLQKGDSIEIGISEDMLVAATLVAYMLPLVTMVVFAYLGSLLGEGDVYSVSGAVLGLVLGGVFSRWHSFKNKSNCRYHAIILDSGSAGAPVTWRS